MPRRGGVDQVDRTTAFSNLRCWVIRDLAVVRSLDDCRLADALAPAFVTESTQRLLQTDTRSLLVVLVDENDALRLQGALDAGHGLGRARQFFTRSLNTFDRSHSNSRQASQILLAQSGQHPCRAYLNGKNHSQATSDNEDALTYRRKYGTKSSIVIIKGSNMSTIDHRAVLLGQESQRYLAMRDQLLTEFPDLDDEALHDTLEGITDLRQMLAEVVRSALEDEALVGGLSTRLSDMKARLERLEARAKRKRQLVLRAMTDCDIQKLAEADFTASLRSGVPALEVAAEDKIPAAYWKPQPPKLDKQGIIAALKTGATVEGATLLPPQPQLSVRTK